MFCSGRLSCILLLCPCRIFYQWCRVHLLVAQNQGTSNSMANLRRSVIKSVLYKKKIIKIPLKSGLSNSFLLLAKNAFLKAKSQQACIKCTEVTKSSLQDKCWPFRVINKFHINSKTFSEVQGNDLKNIMQIKSNKKQPQQTYFCFLLRWCLFWSASVGFLKICPKVLAYSLKTLQDTAKLPSKLSIFLLNSSFMLAISDQRLTLLKNWARLWSSTRKIVNYFLKNLFFSYLKLQCLKRLVKFTQFPSTKACPTVGVIVSRQATKTAHPSQCKGSPFLKLKQKIHTYFP